jgi:hypothetical protein
VRPDYGPPQLRASTSAMPGAEEAIMPFACYKPRLNEGRSPLDVCGRLKSLAISIC